MHKLSWIFFKFCFKNLQLKEFAIPVYGSPIEDNNTWTLSFKVTKLVEKFNNLSIRFLFVVFKVIKLSFIFPNRSLLELS